MSRLRGSAPTLSAILVVVMLLCGFSIATTVYIDQQGTAGLRSELASRAGADLALRASLNLAANAEEQDAEVRAAILRTFEATGVTFDVTRTLESDASFEVEDPPKTGAATMVTVPDLESQAEFSSGSAPTGPDETAVQEDAAAALGLTVGDEVILNDVRFVVSGTWTALDPLDPRWYGNESVATGGIEATPATQKLGPFAIAEEAWSRVEGITTAVWTLVPSSLDDFTASNRGAVSAAWRGIDLEWRGEVTESDSLSQQRRLARTLDEFAGRIEGLRAIEPVAAVLVAGSALVVLSQLVQLLVASRERETELLWARGQSPSSLARRTALEVAVAALLGASVGVGGVILWLASMSSVSQFVAVRSTAIVVPAIVVIGAVVFAAIAAYRSVLSVTTSTKGGRGDGRARRVAVPGVVVLVILGAALAVWQLRLYGSPLTVNAEGFTSIDPIAVAAPAAALVAVVLASLAAFPAVVALYSRRTRNAGVPAHLSARTLALHTGRVAAPLVIVALAVGSATIGASFSATWAHLFNQTAALRAGSDLRVASPFDPLTSAEVDAVASLDTVTAVAPLDEQVLTVGTISGTVLAATPDAVRELATTADGAFNPADAAAAIATEQPGPVIPDGSTALTLRIATTDIIEAPRVSAWAADPLGRLREIAFSDGTPETDGVFSYSADLTAAPVTILSFDLDFAPRPLDAPDPTLSLESLTAEVEGAAQPLELDQFWAADTLEGQLLPPPVNAAGDGFVLPDDLSVVRMTATFDGIADDAISPGVVVTETLATLLELEVGDIISFYVRDSVESLNAIVKAITPAIPGTTTDSAVLMDLAVVNHFHQRANDTALLLSGLWVRSDEPREARDDIRQQLSAGARLITSDDPVGRQVLGAASVALWIAAICCLLIALVAVGSASNARVRWGREDFASLRAVGASAREQSGAIIREMGLVLAVAAAAGLLAGALVSVLTVQELARAAVDRAFLSLGSGVLVDWVGLGVLLAALTLGVAVILFRLTRRVRALATTSLPSEGQE